MGPTIRWLWAAPLIVAALAHAVGLSGGFTNWDDPLYLINNPLTVDPLSKGVLHLLLTPDIDYAIPLTVLVYSLERAVFGLDPVAFHAVSLAMHLSTVLLAYAVARRLGVGAAVAAAGASVFACHPATAEPVAWVVGQKDLLATMLMLAAVFIRARPAVTIRSSAAVAVLSVLALAAKPSAVALPLLLIGVDWCLGRDLRRRGNLVVYLFTMVAAVAATAAAVWGHSDLERPARVGIDTVLHAAWAGTLQLGHLIAPTSLSAAYYPPSGVPYGVFVALGFLLAALVPLAVFRLYRLNARVALFSVVGAVIAYAPVSGIVRISRGPADSYLYAPLALLVPAVALAIEAGWQRRENATRWVLAGVMVVFIAVSAMRATVWSNAVDLWEDVLLENPDQPIAYLRFGNALQYVGKLEKSLAVFEEMERRWPDYHTRTIDHAFTLDALGHHMAAEEMFADGARRGGSSFYRRYYASYLVGHPGLAATDQEIAELSISELAVELVADGAPAAIRGRAADLLELGGKHDDLVRILRSRTADSD